MSIWPESLVVEIPYHEIEAARESGRNLIEDIREIFPEYRHRQIKTAFEVLDDKKVVTLDVVLSYGDILIHERGSEQRFHIGRHGGPHMIPPGANRFINEGRYARVEEVERYQGYWEQIADGNTTQVSHIDSLTSTTT